MRHTTACWSCNGSSEQIDEVNDVSIHVVNCPLVAPRVYALRPEGHGKMGTLIKIQRKRRRLETGPREPFERKMKAGLFSLNSYFISYMLQIVLLLLIL